MIDAVGRPEHLAKYSSPPLDLVLSHLQAPFLAHPIQEQASPTQSGGKYPGLPMGPDKPQKKNYPSVDPKYIFSVTTSVLLGKAFRHNLSVLRRS